MEQSNWGTFGQNTGNPGKTNSGSEVGTEPTVAPHMDVTAGSAGSDGIKNTAQKDAEGILKDISKREKDAAQRPYSGKVKYIELVIRSNTNPEHKYKVSWHDQGEMECDCPGFGFRHTCKHLKYIDDFVKEIEAERFREVK